MVGKNTKTFHKVMSTTMHIHLYKREQCVTTMHYIVDACSRVGQHSDNLSAL